MVTTREEQAPSGPAGAGETPVSFERAQEALFESVGLDARSRFVRLARPNVRTHVFEAGPPDADVPLLFVHGTAAFGATLAPLMAQFDDERVVAFDRPGYGLSDGFAYTEANVRRTSVAAAVAVLDETGTDRVDVVGHSMGGHVGILLALAYPERVRSLTLVGCVPGFPGTAPPLPIRLLTVPVLNRVLRRTQKSGLEGVYDIAEIFGERDVVRENLPFARAVAAHEADAKSAAAGASEFGALLSIRGWHSSVRISPDDLRRLRLPTAFVCGTRDPLGGPDDVREGVAAVPEARVETVPAGHIPFLAHPGRCAEVVRETRPEV